MKKAVLLLSLGCLSSLAMDQGKPNIVCGPCYAYEDKRDWFQKLKESWHETATIWPPQTGPGVASFLIQPKKDTVVTIALVSKLLHGFQSQHVNAGINNIEVRVDGFIVITLTHKEERSNN